MGGFGLGGGECPPGGHEVDLGGGAVPAASCRPAARAPPLTRPTGDAVPSRSSSGHCPHSPSSPAGRSMRDGTFFLRTAPQGPPSSLRDGQRPIPCVNGSNTERPNPAFLLAFWLVWQCLPENSIFPQRRPDLAKTWPFFLSFFVWICSSTGFFFFCSMTALLPSQGRPPLCSAHQAAAGVQQRSL